jgi:hypothetical protein
MSISTIEESEIPEHYSVFTLVHARDPADATGQTVLSAPGHHPKCRIADLKVVVTAYSTAVDVGAIEDGDGNDAATFTCAAVVGSKQTAKTIISGQVFERNEAIVHNLTTDGNAANAYLCFVTLESIH